MCQNQANDFMEGDLCIFYNEDFKSIRIARFKQIAWGQNRKGKFKDRQSNYFDFCEKYNKERIEELSEWLK